MADGYGIGMSARPTDFASGGLSFFNSAIQARKQEIKDHVVEATKNQETMIKAMDMQRLGEVAGKARDGLDKDIQSFRTELVDRYKKSQGRLSSGDRVWMESKSADIQNNIDWTKNQLEALSKAKSLVTPDKWNSYDNMTALSQELVQAEDKIAARDKNVNPMNIVMSHFRTPTPEEILAKRVKDMGLKFDTAPIKTDNGDGTYTVTNKLTPAGLESAGRALDNDPILNNLFTSKDKNGASYVDIPRRDTALQNMYGETGTIRYKPRPAGSGSASVYDLKATDLTLLGKTYPGAYKLNTPVSVTSVNQGIDLATGKPISGGAGKFEVAWIAPDQNKMILVGKESGNKNVVVSTGGDLQYKPDEKSDVTMTFPEVAKDPKKAYELYAGPKRDATGFSASKNDDGSITITGKKSTHVSTGFLGWGAGKEEVSDLPPVTIHPIKDTSAPQYIEVPLDESVLAKSYKKTRLDGVPMQQAISKRNTNTAPKGFKPPWEK